MFRYSLNSFLCRERFLTWERSVSGYLAKGKRKASLGLSVGGLFAYRHAPERLRSRTPWNKSSAYVLYTHYKSEIFKSVILSVLYYIRHFKLFFVKWIVPTFIGTGSYGTVVCNYHFVVVQRYLFYQGVYQHLRLEFQRPLIIRSSMPSTRHCAK